MSHTARGASPPAVRCFSLTYKIFATVYRRPKSRFLFIHIGLRIDRISPKDAGSFGIRLRYAALKVRGGVPRGPEAAGGPGGQAGRVSDSRPSEQNKWSLVLEVLLPRKEVIQPHVPVRLPCYDFTPLTLHTFGASPLKGWAGGFGCRRLGWCDGRCVQGPGTHSPRHADPRLLATPTSWGRVAAPNPNWGRLSGIRSGSRHRIPLYRPL